MDAVNVVEEYAVWCGVPRYWELRLQDNELQNSILGFSLRRKSREDSIGDIYKKYNLLSASSVQSAAKRLLESD